MADIDAAIEKLAESIESCRDDVAAFASKITEVINGGAKGPDAAGGEWAIRRGIPVHREPITAEDIAKHGSYLGPKMRNRRMAVRGDAAIVLWDGKSGGSADMVCRMVARSRPVIVVPMRPPPRDPDARRSRQPPPSEG